MRTQNILEKQIEEGLIKKAVDFAQGVGDVVSGVASLIPGGNLVGSAIDAVSAGVDTLQGDKGDAAFRAASAVGGLIPGVGAAMKAGKLAKAGVAAGKALSKSGKVLGGKTGATLRRAGAGARKVGQAAQTGVNAYQKTRVGRANFSGSGSQQPIPESYGENMSYLDKVKDTVANMKPDKSVIKQQVNAHANPGDKAKSIKPSDNPTGKIKPKLFKSSFNPKNTGSEGY